MPGVTFLSGIRFHAATVSILFGMIGLAALIPLAAGDIAWVAAPGLLLLVAGGALGALLLTGGTVRTAGRLGTWAAVSTALGFAEFFLAVSVMQ